MSNSAPSLFYDRDTLAAWVRVRVKPDPAEWRCVMFSLAHHHLTDGMNSITRFPFVPDGETQEEVISRLCDEFENSARACCEALAFGATGPQRFGVLGHRSTDLQIPADFQMMFLMTPKLKAAESFQTSDPPNLVGGMGIVSRLLQTVLVQHHETMQSDKKLLQEREDRLYTHIERLLEGKIEMAGRLEASLDAQNERHMKVREHEADLAFNHQIKSALLGMGIPLLKQAVEAKWGAPGSNPMLDFARTLKPRQLYPFLKSLEPEQKQQFGHIAHQLFNGLSQEDQEEFQRLAMIDQANGAGAVPATVVASEQTEGDGS